MTIDQAMQQAVAFHTSGKFSEAENLYRQVLAAVPNHAGAMYHLGVLARQFGHNQVAVELLSKALAIAPDAGGLTYLGDLFMNLERIAEAEAAFAQAARMMPNDPAARANHATALWRLKRPEEAKAGYLQALALAPDHTPSLHGLMNVLGDLGDVEGAIKAGRRAAELGVNTAGFWSDYGIACTEALDIDAALDAHERAMKLDPNFGTGHYNLAQTLLLKGEFKRAWPEHEWRWQSARFPSARRTFAQPQWDGSSMPDKTVFVHAEQGFGDAIMFARYLPMVASRAKMIVECQAEIVELIKTVDGVQTVIARGQEPGPFDFHIPMLSLPLVFDTTRQTIPAQVPYIRADAGKTESWKQRLADDPAFRIGIAWAGSPIHPNDRRRSMTLEQFAPLAMESVSFYSLQKGPHARQADHGLGGKPVHDLSEDLRDFTDTAALMENLDLVICIDSAPIHAAGALARPVWVMLPYLPDWRWLIDQPDDTPWYPTMRLFRQHKPGDWAEVVNRVAEELRRRLEERPGT
jgi:tetratricopeptide (TPR) repeat protein